MPTKLLIRGTELRYVIVDHLFRHGPKTILEIIDELDSHGFEVRGSAGKTISDALRWEVGRGRLRRLRRGYFGSAALPRTTEQRIHRRALALRAEAAVNTGRTDDWFWDRFSAYL